MYIDILLKTSSYSNPLFLYTYKHMTLILFNMLMYFNILKNNELTKILLKKIVPMFLFPLFKGCICNDCSQKLVAPVIL